MITLELLGKEWGESVRDWTFRTILHNLVNLVLPPGSAVSENDVAYSLGISRTPVRETFIRLAQDGLLDVYPQKGTYVLQRGEETEMVAALFIVFLVLLFLGLPIAFCLGISSLAYLWMAGIPLMVIP